MNDEGSNQSTFAWFCDFCDGAERRQDPLEMCRSLPSEVGGPILDQTCLEAAGRNGRDSFRRSGPSRAG